MNSGRRFIQRLSHEPGTVTASLLGGAHPVFGPTVKFTFVLCWSLPGGSLPWLFAPADGYAHESYEDGYPHDDEYGKGE